MRTEWRALISQLEPKATFHPPASPEALQRLEAFFKARLPHDLRSILEQSDGVEGEHGLATWRYRVPAGAALTGPEPSNGGGQFWVVLAGTLATGESGWLPVNSTIFVGPADGALSAVAGSGGAEALCLQFRVPYAARG